MNFSLGMTLTFLGNTRIFFPQRVRVPESLFEDFYRIFLMGVVICPLGLQGINNMWICFILSPYFSRPWSWTEYGCHIDHALVVCGRPDWSTIRLPSFVPAGLNIANENKDLPYFGGPWTDYQCYSGTTVTT